MSFVHLHCHTHYSLLDGLPKPKDYLLKAKEHGSPALAITDHGNLYGAVEFYRSAKELDIKPIIGIEAYMAASSRFSKQSGIDNQIGHFILLAKNLKGYENLMALSTLAHLEGFYYKPRLDFELLEQYGEGLVLLTGCLNGDIPKALLANRWEDAAGLLDRFQAIFGKENVFLELQDHPQLLEQGLLNERLIDLASRTQAPLVATNDCHCLGRDDKEAHDILLCIQTGTNILDEKRFRIDGDITMRSPEEMRQAFEAVPQAIENTLQIADMCNVEIPLGQNLLPSFPTPDKKTDQAYLRELCDEGVLRRYGQSPDASVSDRLNYELEIIHGMGFDTYFLIVHDFVAFAKSSGILVGPGRGSAAGSIVAYCLGITDVDPLQYGLLFERFLNPERVSMPDIDIDFADKRRDEVLAYVVQRYGKDRVAQIITFGTMAARAAVRDVGRGLGMPYSDVDVIAKLIPGRPGIKLSEALEEEPELRLKSKASPAIKKLLDLALKLEGVVRHASVHACAVVISGEPLIKHTPLQMAPGGQDAVITQYSMHEIEAIGLLKMDFLGLRNLTVLEYALEIIQRTKDTVIDWDTIPLDDEETFKLMARGETTGVFQFESSGMRRYLKELIPSRFQDLIAMNALYRPGPMDWIPAYIKGRHNANKVHYLHDSFKPILEETYGVAVYQEQILQLARLVAGFSLGEADLLRKAVGKKKPKLLAEQRVKFIQGAVQQGHKEAFAKEVFVKVIEPFAGYGFNKAHATCYAMIAYRTAYLKSHYPAEFMAALMTSDGDNTDRIVIEINEASAMGIEVLPPSLNESMAHFTVVDDQHIRFGLAAIKGVGLGTVREILAIRDKGGPFVTLEDFARRIPYSLLNKKTLEALAYSGALDDLSERRRVVNAVEEICRYARQVQADSNTDQVDIFSMLDEDQAAFPPLVLPDVPPASLLQRLTWEKTYLGLYVSGHPLQGLTSYIKKKVDLIESFDLKKVGRMVKLSGLMVHIKKVTTKKGSSMAYITLEDPSHRIEMILFPNVFLNYRALLVQDTMVVAEGKLEFRQGRFQLICQSVQAVSLETMIARAKEANLYHPNERLRLHMRATPSEEENLTEEIVSEKVLSPPPVSLSSPEPFIENSVEIFSEQSPFVIRLGESEPSVHQLEKIKNFLLHHRGDSPAEIHLLHEGNFKRIKIPFGIQVTHEFKLQLKELI
ncbi:MAG: hypothetical protein ACD_28C00317G0025 [uncultured bacterium]|nr:MAG: hypothetical protein ACD_28C00317G0025 [uncultured bacterium]KKT77111.1 MAG: polymerase III catalytic subunit, DnaE type protein [Candidatus Peregrinibacteria bacterium GW2011_GWA2_44_7]